jgi:hypothetical protein
MSGRSILATLLLATALTAQPLSITLAQDLSKQIACHYTSSLQLFLTLDASTASAAFTPRYDVRIQLPPTATVLSKGLSLQWNGLPINDIETNIDEKWIQFRASLSLGTFRYVLTIQPNNSLLNSYKTGPDSGGLFLFSNSFTANASFQLLLEPPVCNNTLIKVEIQAFYRFPITNYISNLIVNFSKMCSVFNEKINIELSSEDSHLAFTQISKDACAIQSNVHIIYRSSLPPTAKRPSALPTRLRTVYEFPKCFLQILQQHSLCFPWTSQTSELITSKGKAAASGSLCQWTEMPLSPISSASQTRWSARFQI